MILAHRYAVNVLILEDRKEFAQFVALLLKRNFEITPDLSYTVDHAVDLVRNGQYDVVISDFRLGMDDARSLFFKAKYFFDEACIPKMPRFAVLTSHDGEADGLLGLGFEAVWSKDHAYDQFFVEVLDAFLFPTVGR
ncbi:MAG: hypothetical protein AAFX93_19625 [Verrucomicrobiota bacterium]